MHLGKGAAPAEDQLEIEVAHALLHSSNICLFTLSSGKAWLSIVRRLIAFDYVQVRSGTGELSLRELTGCIALGQEEPLQRVPHPSKCRYACRLCTRSDAGLSAGTSRSTPGPTPCHTAEHSQ